MPLGLRRFHEFGHSHFLTFSCDGRKPYLAKPSTRFLVEDGLERTRRRYGFHVFGYVIMPEHVHVLLSEPRTVTVAEIMKSWKLSVTLRQPIRPLWEERYHDFNVFTTGKHVEKLRYIHRNPVVRGLVERPENWQWSSFRHHLTGESGKVCIESRWTMEPLQPGSENPDPGHPLRASEER